MHTINTIGKSLDEAGDTAALLAASSAAFELIHQICAAYLAHAPESYAMWMSVIPLACNGRDELGCGYPRIALPEETGPGTVSEDDAADQLAALAAKLGIRLRDAADNATSPEERQACHRAAATADEIRGLLALDA
jgi:hypothetical protein